MQGKKNRSPVNGWYKNGCQRWSCWYFHSKKTVKRAREYTNLYQRGLCFLYEWGLVSRTRATLSAITLVLHLSGLVGFLSPLHSCVRRQDPPSPSRTHYVRSFLPSVSGLCRSSILPESPSPLPSRYHSYIPLPPLYFPDIS